MTEKRSKMDIYFDILKVLKGDQLVIKTHIVYGANLNQSKASEWLDRLGEYGLVEGNVDSGWSITDRGAVFIEKYEELREILPRRSDVYQ